jgi:hypothetical protein
MFPTGSNPNTNAFRSYSPGPHSGVDPDVNVYVDSGAMDSRARNALILGLFSLVLGIVTGAPAIWVGLRALRHINAAEGSVRGRWAAWTGIALGLLGVVGTVAVWITLHQS